MITPAFTHNDYEKITDDLMYLGFKYIMRFNVILARKNKDGDRISFHNEYRYETRKYNDTFAGNTIRRHLDYYISIESTKQDDYGNKDFVMITNRDMIYLRLQLNYCMNKWFMSNIYEYIDNKLIIKGRPDPIKIDGLVQGKYILLSPIVIENNGQYLQGIRFVLNNSNTFDLSVLDFSEFTYLINSIDMYNAASTLMTYFGKPEFGTNMFSMSQLNEQYNDTNINEKELDTGKKRDIKSSFFD